MLTNQLLNEILSAIKNLKVNVPPNYINSVAGDKNIIQSNSQGNNIQINIFIEFNCKSKKQNIDRNNISV